MHRHDDTPPPSVEAAVRAYVDALLSEAPEPADAALDAHARDEVPTTDPREVETRHQAAHGDRPDAADEPVLGTFGPGPFVPTSAEAGTPAAQAQAEPNTEPAAPETHDAAPDAAANGPEPAGTHADSNADEAAFGIDDLPLDSLPDGMSEYRVCRISSIRVAIPVKHLQGIEVMSPAVHFAGSSWNLGRHHDGEREWTVVDLAQIVAPGVPRPRPDRLLLVANTEWALACTLEDHPLRLHDSQVRWRTGGGLRPWLVGMTYEHKCAIIELDALIEQLTTDPRYS